MDDIYLIPIIIIFILGPIALFIIMIRKTWPRFILKSKKFKAKIDNATTGLEFRNLCKELAALRQNIPDHESQTMVSFNNTLRELGVRMDRSLLPEIVKLKTLSDLNHFMKIYDFLYKEMGIFMPFGKFERFSQYKLFPKWFLQERVKRLDIIEEITNKMNDPFKILDLLYKEVPTGPEQPFPYFLNDEDEPIPMEIRKRVGGLFLEVAKNADSKETFIRIFRYGGIFTDHNTIQALFIAYIKKVKISGVFWEWKSYIGGIIEIMDALSSPISVLSPREYFNILYEYLEKEKTLIPVKE